eukprot:5152985-Alexandrium_andersonii.AAC.1
MVADLLVEKRSGIPNDLGLHDQLVEEGGRGRGVEAVNAGGQRAHWREVRVQRVSDFHCVTEGTLPSCLEGPLVDHWKGLLLGEVRGVQGTLYFTRDQVVEVAVDDDEAVLGVELREGVLLLDVLRDQVRAVGAELEVVDVVVHEEA